MKNWKEVLSDTSSYPDDFVVSLKDGQTMTLGSMREYDREHEGALTQKLTAKERELGLKEQQVAAASQQVLDMFNKYLETTGLSAEEALAGKTPTAKRMAEMTGLETGDPQIRELVSSINTVKEELNSTRSQLSELREKAVKPVVSTYLEDWYEAKYERAQAALPKKAQEKVDYDSVFKHAEKNNFRDKKGRLDLDKAAKDLASPYIQEEWRESERAKIKKEVEQEQFAASLPKPGTNRAGAVAKDFKDDKGRTISIEESMNRALEDGDLWKGIVTQQ